jgi:hypothetical protein
MYMISSVHDQNGIILFGNGDVYKGCIKDSMVSGQGCYFFLNGDSLHGRFENGRALSGMVYMWKNTDTAFIDYKDGVFEKWVQLCIDNDIYAVRAQHIVGSIHSLTLYKSYALELPKRGCRKDLSVSRFRVCVQ